MELFKAFGRLVLEGQDAVNRGLKQFEAWGERAARKMEDMGKRAKALGNSLTKYVTAPLTAATTALGALATKTANYGREVSRLSQVANTDTQTFQKWAAGAATVGIEQDKLADILKDVNDRVGDFLTTGGGPMADFFEQVAPKVGLTAEHFKNLSGPQALQLYVSALEAANLNQQEMTFYLEAMASDSTLLIPLLRNAGSEMNRLGAEAEAAGAIMSEDGIKSSEAFQAELVKLRQAFQGIIFELGEAFLPILTQLMQIFREEVVPILKSVADWVGDLLQGFANLSPEMQKTVVVAGLLVAALGPILSAIGMILGPLATLVRVVTSVTRVLGILRLAALVPLAPIIAKITLAIGALWLAWEGAKLIWPMLKEVFGWVVDGAFWLVDQISSAFAAIPGIVSQVVDWFGGMYDGVVGWFKQLPGAVWNYVKSMADGVINRVRNMVQGVINSLKSMYNAVVGNSIIPDLADDVVKVVGHMADGSIDETERMTKGMEDAMPREGFDPSSPAFSVEGSRAPVIYDMRHSVFRDDRDMLARMRLRGVEATGAY